jgi:hypothetical protein
MHWNYIAKAISIQYKYGLGTCKQLENGYLKTTQEETVVTQRCIMKGHDVFRNDRINALL